MTTCRSDWGNSALGLTSKSTVPPLRAVDKWIGSPVPPLTGLQGSNEGVVFPPQVNQTSPPKALRDGIPQLLKVPYLRTYIVS